MKDIRTYLAAVLAAACFFPHPINAAQTLTRSTGELVCPYTSIAVGEAGNAVVTCAGTVVVTPPPPPPPPVDTTPVPPPASGCVVRDIPFARYLSEGCDLFCVQTIRGWGALHKPCEFEAAYQAGHPRPDGGTGGTGGTRPMPTDDLTGYENGGFIPQHQFPSAAIRWTASASGSARFVLVEETHPSTAQSLTATVTDSTGALVGSVQTGRPIAATVDVPFIAVAGRTYYLIVTPDAPLWRHVELRTR